MSQPIYIFVRKMHFCIQDVLHSILRRDTESKIFKLLHDLCVTILEEFPAERVIRNADAISVMQYRRVLAEWLKGWTVGFTQAFEQVCRHKFNSLHHVMLSVNVCF